MDSLNEKGSEIIKQANDHNKNIVTEQLDEINTEWKKLISGLEERRKTLEALLKHWEEFDSKRHAVETQLNSIEEKNKLVDTTVKSRQHVLDTIKNLDVSFF